MRGGDILSLCVCRLSYCRVSEESGYENDISQKNKSSIVDVRFFVLLYYRLLLFHPCIK